MPDQIVNIQPGVNVLSVLRHLNYKPWYALGEFVDNALQSALDNWKDLQQLHKGKYRLKVTIEIEEVDGGRIVVRDNAAGIPASAYHRAFRTAEVPPDRKGLSEFGMGMKSAGFWFSTKWSVRTKALGESFSGFIDFDLTQITNQNLDALPVKTTPANTNEHFTELTLHQPQKMPVGRTIGKIKEHLTGIYRQFLRDGRLELVFKNEPLKFTEPSVLKAPHPKNPDGKPIKWNKPIKIELTGGKTISGFVAIREEGSVSEAGLALFRRNRLIVGSADEGYRPPSIFGHSNDFRYQRVFGELSLDGFGVSHTKDGFQWEELEDEFLEKLRTQINSEPLPILAKALEHRVRPKTIDIRRGAQTALSSTTAVLEKAGPVIETQRKDAPITSPPPPSLPDARETAASRELSLSFQDQDWNITIELANDSGIGSWLDICSTPPLGKVRAFKIRLNCAHPFMQQFGGTEAQQIEPLLRIATALAISEIVAREQGIAGAGTIRHNLNKLLTAVLSASSTQEPS